MANISHARGVVGHLYRTYRPHYRSFTSTSVHHARRAIVYNKPGNPAEALRVLTVPEPLPAPSSSRVNIRFLLSPVNPSDINVVEGAYPVKPAARSAVDLSFATSSQGRESRSESEEVFIGGNEGVAEVTSVGSGVSGLKEGDWVVMVAQQSGTWCLDANVSPADVVRIPRVSGRLPSQVQAATMTVNPPTAFNMLRNFVDLKPGDWVLQNGANSAVGEAVIQIAADRGLKTINLVRDRDDFASLEQRLTALGGTHVLPYSALDPTTDKEQAKATRASLKALFAPTSGPRLALNCVSGPATTHMSALLGHSAVLVSYGAMSRQPLSLPTSLFIFKDLTCKGFWQSPWYKEKGPGEREALMRDLVALMVEGKVKDGLAFERASDGALQLREPEHEIVSIEEHEDDETATRKVRQTMSRLQQGKYGRKVLLRFSP